MSKLPEKPSPQPSASAEEKPLTGAALDRALLAKSLSGAALDRALKAGNAPSWDAQGRRSAPPVSKIRSMPKRGKK